MTYIGDWAPNTQYNRHDITTVGNHFYSVYGQDPWVSGGNGTSGTITPTGTCGSSGNPYATTCGTFLDHPTWGYFDDGGLLWSYTGPANPVEWQPNTPYDTSTSPFVQSGGNVYLNNGDPFGGPLGVSGTIAPTGTYEVCCDSEFPYVSDGSLMWSWVGTASGPSVVPEPTSFLLLFVGILMLTFAGSKRRRKAKQS